MGLLGKLEKIGSKLWHSGRRLSHMSNNSDVPEFERNISNVSSASTVDAEHGGRKFTNLPIAKAVPISKLDAENLHLPKADAVEMPWQVSKWMDELERPDEEVLRKAIVDSWATRDRDSELAAEILADKPASNCGSFDPPDELSDQLAELMHPMDQDAAEEPLPDSHSAFMVDGIW